MLGKIKMAIAVLYDNTVPNEPCVAFGLSGCHLIEFVERFFINSIKKAYFLKLQTILFKSLSKKTLRLAHSIKVSIPNTIINKKSG